MIVLSSQKTTNARKAHVCNFCGCTIKVGSTYLKQSNVHEGELYTWKSHEKCMELVSALNMEGDEGVTMEDFYEYITDKFKELWSDIDNELYESKNFVIPEFKEQVDFVYSKVCSD